MPVGAFLQHGGHVYALLCEVAGQIGECVVFLHRCPDDADEAFSGIVGEAEVLAVTAAAGYGFAVGGLVAFQLAIEFDKLCCVHYSHSMVEGGFEEMS